MVKKLSDTKVSKIFNLYFQGYSQTEIANKLKITQASVSIHVSKFKSLAKQQGIKAAAEEYGVMDQVEALYDLAVDIKKAQITVEEAENGLKMSLVLQECGVEEEDYGDLIKTCEKIKNEDYLFAAIELSQLEESTGMSYEDIVTEYKSTAKQLTQAQKELQDIHGKIDSSNKELENINKQKQFANQDLKAHMDQIGVDMHRLEMVEALALTLKEAGVPNQELPVYVQRQQLLNKAGISINLLAMIIEKVNVITSQDHGKKLFSLLSEYGNLSDTNKALQLRIESLTKQTAGLEQQAKLQGKIQGEIADLKAEKASLEPQIANLYIQKDELKHIKDQLSQINNEINSLTSIKALLEQKITQLKTYRESQEKEIELRESKVSDLKEVESKRDAILKEIAKLEVRVKDDQRRWDIYQSFLGLVLKGSIAEMEKFSEVLPSLLEDVKRGEYKPESMKSHILQRLAGPELLVFKCMRCQETFRISKPVPSGGYYCPKCGLTHGVIVDKDAADMLHAMLLPETPKHKVIVKSIIAVTQPKNSDGKV